VFVLKFLLGFAAGVALVGAWLHFGPALLKTPVAPAPPSAVVPESEEERICAAVAAHELVAPSTMKIIARDVFVFDGQGSVTLVYESLNRLGVPIRDKATCDFDPKGRSSYDAGKKSNALVKFCSSRACLDGIELSWAANEAYEKQIMPRIRPDRSPR
jgi:hypothetical protein